MFLYEFKVFHIQLYHGNKSTFIFFLECVCKWLPCDAQFYSWPQKPIERFRTVPPERAFYPLSFKASLLIPTATALKRYLEAWQQAEMCGRAVQDRCYKPHAGSEVQSADLTAYATLGQSSGQEVTHEHA